MHLGIDASNLRRGGGITHIVEFLRAADPQAHGFSEIVIWGGDECLKHIEDRAWLVKDHQPLLDRSLPHRVFWQRRHLSRLARIAGCHILLVPGGSYWGDFHPVVSMCRNMLPFEIREMVRYGLSWMTLKLALLRWTQSVTFRRSDGVIFLTAYAQNTVRRIVGPLSGNCVIVSHGVNERFTGTPREHLGLDKYSESNPFRLLYVSIVDVYKHQWNVARAVSKLRAQGYPVVLDLVGPAYGPALRRLETALNQVDPRRAFIRYLGAIPHKELNRAYDLADLGVFASSCENMPNILLESMASGLPVASSDRGPMPEILGHAGVYFDPLNTESIESALKQLLGSPFLREDLAQKSVEVVRMYSWRRCADQTLAFLADVVATHSKRLPQVPHTLPIKTPIKE